MSLALVMSVVASRAGGQEFRATITGRVADAQGAVVPGATIAVTNVDTNVSLTTVTNETGAYTVATLQPGTYRIAASLSGFKTFVREAIVLRTAETGTVNVQLQLGDVEETVTVVGGLSAVESNQSTLAQTMENKRVSELPLNGRQVYMLLQLTAGTFFTQTTFGSTGSRARAPGTPTATSRSTEAGPVTTNSCSTARRTRPRAGGSTRRRWMPSRSSRCRRQASTRPTAAPAAGSST
jgi:hypothetical protein